ncbi:two-component regulator propeller domain-containing protein [Luteolibacter ambystomatis]|nr:sensor histidine kinase [Luteolibacter ambystomatis]
MVVIRRMAVAVWLAGGIACPAARAIPPEVPFSSRAWETDDGLPHGGVNAVLRREDGFLWIATQGGLVRFDGMEFVQKRSPLLSDARSSRVIDIIEENPRTMLAACDTSGLVRLEEGGLSVHPLSASLGSGRRILSLFHESADVFWVLCSDRELWRWDHGSAVRFPPTEHVYTSAPSSFVRMTDGSVLLTRGDGLERFQKGLLAPVTGIPERSIIVSICHGGGAWVASPDRLLKLDGDAISVSDAAVPWLGTPPAVMLEDHEHALWIGTKFRGLFRREGDVIRPMDTSHARITSLSEDADGNIWAGTAGGGLNRFQHARFQLLGEKEGWMSDIVGSVCEDGKGRLWFGNTNLGLRQVGEGRFLAAPPVAGWPHKAMPIRTDAAGSVWVGINNRLGRLDPDSGTMESIAIPSLGSLHVIFTDRRNRVWVGGDFGGLLRVEDGSKQRLFGADDGFTGLQIRSMEEDARGTLWIGTEQGEIFEHRGDGFIRHAEAEGLRGSAVRSIVADADGTLWVGTGGGGLFVRRNERFTSIGEEQGLPDDVISQLLDDGAGALWFGASRALYRVKKSELLDCAAGRVAGVHPVRFGEGDDLPNFSAAANYQPSCWRTRAGTLCFVSRKGLVIADPSVAPHEARALQVHLDKLVADGRALPPGVAKVPSSARKIEFQFTAPTFTSPEKVRYRYRLTGLDAEWSEPTATRSATYSPLKPGRYRFEVAACDSNLVWSPLVTSLPIEIVPAWWETWWARVLAVVVSGALLVVAVRYWSHQRLKARLLQLESGRRLQNERARIARDLHDGLGAGLTQVGMMAEELAEEGGGVEEMKSYSAGIAGRVRDLARDLDAAVWSVSPKNDTLAALCGYICQYAIEYFRETPVRCLVHVAPDIPAVALSPEDRHHLFLIAKEILNNVLKHAGASQVILSMGPEEADFVIAFEDNGRGFPSTTAPDRHGLENIRERVAAVGGVMDLRSSGEGTAIRIRLSSFPLAEKPLSSH